MKAADPTCTVVAGALGFIGIAHNGLAGNPYMTAWYTARIRGY